MVRKGSHGKNGGAGLDRFWNKGSTDQHAYVQQLREGRSDFFATFIEVQEEGVEDSIEVEPGIHSGDFLQGFLLGTREALSEKKRPSLTLTLERLNAKTLGSLIALFVTECRPLCIFDRNQCLPPAGCRIWKESRR